MMTKRAKVLSPSPQLSLMEGVRAVYEVAKAAYGPLSGNAIIEKVYGEPLISHDGVTNIDEVYLEDPVQNMGARAIAQASRKSNKSVGDGTTAVAILAYHLFTESQKLIAAGINVRQVSQHLQNAANIAHEHIDKLTKKTTEDMLIKVATISAGDSALGAMIADIIGEVGIDGGVLVEHHDGLGVSNEIVDGFYFAKGLSHMAFATDFQNLRAMYEDVPILLTDKRLSKQTDIAPILDQIASNGVKELVIIGEVTDEALALLALNKQKGIITTTPVEPPVYGGGRTLFLDDLAVLTGGKVYSEGEFSTDMLGAASKVVITEFNTTIVGADGDSDEVKSRIAELQDNLETAQSPITISAIKDRLAKLTGKVAIIRVGGAVELEQEETKLRVDDAVCATQAAIRGGVVPGGGVTLATVSGTHFDDAFKKPLEVLSRNAGLNPQSQLAALKKASEWCGFDLLAPIGAGDWEPVDLLEAGILDPAQVLHEIVTNATSVVSKLISVSVAITYADREP